MNLSKKHQNSKKTYEKLPFYSFFDDIFRLISKNKDIPLKEIHLIGGRLSGKTIAIYIFFAELFSALKKRVRIYAFRKKAKTIHNTIYQEFANALKRVNLRGGYLEHLSSLYFKNKYAKISFHSFNDKDDDVTLSGLASAQGYDYAIKHWEERGEFTEDDIHAGTEAVRGCKRKLTICSSNPWKKNSDYVQWANEKLPFDLYELKTKGYQIYLKDEILIIYMNYQINNLIMETDKNYLDSLKSVNPQRALTACYGYPSELKGSIYAYAMKYVERVSTFSAREKYMMIVGGVDFGYRNDAMTCIIVGIKPNFDKIDIINEYYFNPKMEHKDLAVIAREIIALLGKTLDEHAYLKFYPRGGSSSIRGIIVKCDYSEFSFIHLLQNVVLQTPYKDLIFFEACNKIQVNSRVTLQLNIMECGIMRVKEHCINFWRELELAQWDEKKLANDTVLDKDNHTQDAFHYGVIIPFWSDLTAKVNYNFWYKERQ